MCDECYETNFINGTKLRFKKGTKYTIIAPAQNDKGIAYGQYVEFWPGRRYPFMYPAMEANRDEIKRKVIKAIKEG